jgi:hypothetical protein
MAAALTERGLTAAKGQAELFFAHLLARNSRVEEDLVDQLFNSSEKRLARTPSASGEFWQGRSAGANRRLGHQTR